MNAGRRFTGETLVIATHNEGKAKEMAALLGGYVLHCPTAGSLEIPEPDETATTFAGNAILKALAVAQASGKPALADDSGLAVVALGGQPGIYSARWAGPDKDFVTAMQRIDTELARNKDRSAAFVCALALAWPNGNVETVEGRIDGWLTTAPRGRNGFGYDPWFIPVGHDKTFAEMTPARKQAISHRAAAFRLLIERCF